jgi:hypothetical protein
MQMKNNSARLKCATHGFLRMNADMPSVIGSAPGPPCWRCRSRLRWAISSLKNVFNRSLLFDLVERPATSVSEPA